MSFLKAAGVSEPIAMAIAGHSSAAMSRVYTSIPLDTLRTALDKLPDVTQ